jgi:hypothetical protein
LRKHLRHEGHQLGGTGDVRNLPRRNVFDTTHDAVRQLRARVQVQHEGTVGVQFEPSELRGLEWRGSKNVPLPLHAADNTKRCRHPR